jgi:hypothetical protein
MAMQPWVRTVYLYLFAFVGLLLVTIGGVQFLNMGLRATIFTQADAQERLRMPPPAPFGPKSENMEAYARNPQLSPDDRAAVQQWLEDYKRWQKESARIDPVRANREREAANALAMILVGLPLYLFHWRLIRREPEPTA